MGTTFVSLIHEASDDEIGFWMRDGILELWLRLLALHVPEPTENHSVSYEIRNQWLLASRGYFGGCIPHGLAEAASTEDGRGIIRVAIRSLLERLRHAPAVLDGKTLDLLGIENNFKDEFETYRLLDVGKAFLDLLDGTITSTVRSTDFMPGSE